MCFFIILRHAFYQQKEWFSKHLPIKKATIEIHKFPGFQVSGIPDFSRMTFQGTQNEFRMIRTCRATPGEYRSKYQRDYHGFHRTNES